MPGIVVAFVTLLPLASHLRWVGTRRAITEPSSATIVLLFYLSVFPLRALAIEADRSISPDFVRYVVTDQQLIVTLLLASLATTVFIECFHLARRADRNVDPQTTVRLDLASTRDNAVALAGFLGVGSVLGLFMAIMQNGGPIGAISTLSSHSKDIRAAFSSPATTVWFTCAVPAVWCLSLVAVDRGVDRFIRRWYISLIVVILLGQLVYFGSRLYAILGVLGAWVIAYYAGRRVSPRAVLGSVALLLAISGPVLAYRDEASGARPDTRPLLVQYSEIAGYGILDISLAVRQEPDRVRGQIEASDRWSNLPGYLAPSFLGGSRTDMEKDRMDRYVVRAFGTPVQQESGFPTSFSTEAWLYGGWVGAVAVGALFGLVFGALHRFLVEGSRTTAAGLLFCAALTTAAFSWYKDGDILSRVVAEWRTVLFLGAVMVAFGVWAPIRLRYSRRARLARL